MSDEAYPDALPAGHPLHWYVLEQAQAASQAVMRSVALELTGDHRDDL